MTSDGNTPAILEAIERATHGLGFSTVSERETGQLLRALAATKPGGRFLEIGTGTGLSAAWLLDGMDAASRLLTIDCDARVAQVAIEHLAGDPRIQVRIADGDVVLDELGREGVSFDFIFADTELGKLRRLADTLRLLEPGGIYLVDHAAPDPGEPADYVAKLQELEAELTRRPDLHVRKIAFPTGIILASRRPSHAFSAKPADPLHRRRQPDLERESAGGRRGRGRVRSPGARRR